MSCWNIWCYYLIDCKDSAFTYPTSIVSCEYNTHSCYKSILLHVKARLKAFSCRKLKVVLLIYHLIFIFRLILFCLLLFWGTNLSKIIFSLQKILKLESQLIIFLLKATFPDKCSSFMADLALNKRHAL